MAAGKKKPGDMAGQNTVTVPAQGGRPGAPRTRSQFNRGASGIFCLPTLDHERFGGILGTMDIRNAVLSSVVHYRGLCFQWLVLYDADKNMGYMHRVGNVQMASDWIESEEIISIEVWSVEPTIIPELPISDGKGAVDALLERTTAEELVQNPLPEWKPVEWFVAGLPEHIEVYVTRKFIEM